MGIVPETWRCTSLDSFLRFSVTATVPYKLHYRRVLGDLAKIRTQYITPSHGHSVGQDAGVVARCILVPALGAGFDDRGEVSCYTWYWKEASVFQARVAYEEKSKSLFKFTQHGIRTVVL